jgi:hypothetical protein
MSAWSGWEAEFLKAAGLPLTTSNEAFLNQWNTYDNTNCRNNPIDLSRQTAGSTACADLPNGKKARNYLSHAQAASTFSAQLKSGGYPNLLAALRSGQPYAVANPSKVAQDLGKWGSGIFQQAYVGAASTPPPSPGGNLNAPRAHGGWRDLRRSINRNMPRSLNRAHNLTQQALRATSHGRRVKM